jgi:flagellar secretion chaperone FliS
MNQSYHSPSANRYLDTRVTTASQPELQLMLLDGAIRFGRRAQELWNSESNVGECERLLGRAMAIVEELVRGVTGRGLEAASRLEEEYAFIYRQLALGRVARDAAALQSALSVLEFHRETWRLACEKVKPPAHVAPPASGAPAPNFLRAAERQGDRLSVEA